MMIIIWAFGIPWIEFIIYLQDFGHDFQMELSIYLGNLDFYISKITIF